MKLSAMRKLSEAFSMTRSSPLNAITRRFRAGGPQHLD
jgi:hypothetical protein